MIKVVVKEERVISPWYGLKQQQSIPVDSSTGEVEN